MNSTIQPRSRPIAEIVGEFYGTNLSQIVCDDSIMIHGPDPINRSNTTGLTMVIERTAGNNMLFGQERHTIRVLARRPDPILWEAHLSFCFPNGRDTTLENLLREAWRTWEHPLQVLEKPGWHVFGREEDLHGFTVCSNITGGLEHAAFTFSMKSPDGSTCYEMVGSARML